MSVGEEAENEHTRILFVEVEMFIHALRMPRKIDTSRGSFQGL